MKQSREKYIGKISVMFLIILCIDTLLCGAKKVVFMDTQDNIVYQSVDADRVLEDFSGDVKAAKNKYNNNYYLIYGKVVSKSKNNKEIVIGAVVGDEISDKITCKLSDKADIKYSSGLSNGDLVRIYGKFDVSFKNALLFKEVKGISKVETVQSSDDGYSVFGGKIIKKSLMKRTVIKGSNITYYVPSEWKAVEHDIKKEGLGSARGYQYRLNEIGNKEAEAESFFVCYFDKKTGVDINDRGNNKLIEEAILRDVLGKENLKSFPFKTINTYYGTNYKYYRDIFKRSTGEKYQVEVAFQEKGDGIVFYVYVCNNQKHISDIMVVMRLLEI